VAFSLRIFALIATFLFAICAALLVQAEVDRSTNTLVISAKKASYSLAAVIEILPDPQREYTLEQVTGNFAAQFKHYENPTRHAIVGSTRSAYWFRFSVANPTNQALPIFIELAQPIIDYYDLYAHSTTLATELSNPQLSNPQLPIEQPPYEHRAYGIQLPYYQRDFNLNSFVTEFRLEPGETKQFYARAISPGTAYFPFTLYTHESIQEQVFYQYLSIGIIIGIMAGLLAYNCFLYYNTRLKTYLYYNILVLTTIVGTLARNNFLHHFWPNSPHWNHFMIFGAPILYTITLLQFFRIYLNSAQFFKKIDKVLQIFTVYSLVCLGLINGVIDLQTFQQIYLPFSLVIAYCYIYMCVARWKEGFQPAKWLLLGITMPILNVIMWTLILLEVLPSSEFAELIMQNTDMLQLFFLSIGVADIVKVLEQDKTAQEHNLLSAKALNQAKSIFLTKMSHEIRTPLNGVLGTAQLLKDSVLDNQQRHFVEVINSSGESLLTIINDILDLSNINDGNLRIEKGWFNLQTCLSECTEVFSLIAEQKKLRFVCSIDPRIPEDIYADPLRIRQVVINLLGNAFKFTSQGSVSIKVMLLTQHDEVLHLKFEVTDTGAGISDEYQKKLFHHYGEEKASISREYGGSGLGLAISQKLVGLMQGEIGVSGEINVGSRFWFSLKSEKSKASTPQTLTNQLAGKRVLFADEDESYCAILRQLADHWQVKLQIAQDSQEVLRFLQSSMQSSTQASLQSIQAEPPAQRPAFDIICINNELRDISGEECIHRSKELLSGLATPLLFMTGVSANYHHILKVNPVIDHIFPKPITVNGIAKQWYKALKIADAYYAIQHQDSQQQDRHSLETQTSQQLKLLLDRQLTNMNARALVAEDNEINQKVILGMLKKLGISCTLTGNGKEVVETYRFNPSAFDIILMDCEMPMIDGYSATESIRKYEQDFELLAIPIIAVSAHALAEHKHKSLAAGMNDHLAKPLKIDILAQKIAEWIIKREAGL